MEMLWAAVAVFGVALGGVFWTKTPGWGRYTSSLLILLLVLFVATLGFLREQVGSAPLLNLLFAIAGYAGGLIGARD